MSKKFYEETDVQALADAIRAKNGSTNKYKLSEMAQAVTDIPSGGGGDIDGFVDGTVTSIKSDATKVAQYACYKFTELVSVDLPNATSIGTSAFNSCTALTTANLPNATSVNMYAFQKCGELLSISLPNATSILNSAFQECSKLSFADCGNAKSLGPAAFINCSALSTLILRYEKVCTLSNVNVLSATPIADGTGYIYVPDNLVDSYKSATNWSTYAAQIKPVSEYVEE